ncbi:YitT family protein [Carnobacterium sp. ISL-102]|uniref:YitT family protein n=1 Tax=Carnobacterium TaxID=2747 RepID=UPI001BEA95AB|nr:YitT family protein [Carnobacterium sp. ISL-102]MBT2731527.1 YitT family protein [Carnobacterium sp. ISL-102]
MINEKIAIKDLFIITIGCALYAFGLVYINIANELAEGGMTGISLLLRYWFQIDPALSTLLLNIPTILIGWKLLGNRSLIYTIYGTTMLSFFLYIWQRTSIAINIDNDLFIAGILAGLCGGVGSGMIYRSGGTTGGSDILARILEKKKGISMGKTLLVFDVFILTLSLTYIDLPHMMYTLLASYVFSKIVDFMQDGSYAARGLLIISDKNDTIAENIMLEMERGVTFFKAEGAYSKEEKKVLYCVLGSHEIVTAKRIIHETDPKAFLSLLTVHEVLGEGFSFDPKPKQPLFKKKATL